MSDDLLDHLVLEKGKRKVVDHNERGKVLRALDGKNYKVTAGGSLSNTLVALARLGQGAVDAEGKELVAPLSVAMTGSVGSDPLGQFYRWVSVSQPGQELLVHSVLQVELNCCLLRTWCLSKEMLFCLTGVFWESTNWDLKVALERQTAYSAGIMTGLRRLS